MKKVHSNGKAEISFKIMSSSWKLVSVGIQEPKGRTAAYGIVNYVLATCFEISFDKGRITHRVSCLVKRQISAIRVIPYHINLFNLNGSVPVSKSLSL